MSEYGGGLNLPPPDPGLSRKAAIVGVGETDFHSDYKAARAKSADYVRPTAESLASIAFERALADCGLGRRDIDGLSTSFIYGGPPPDELAKQLGVEPRYLIDNGGILAGQLPIVCAAIAQGKCETMAMVYSAPSRATERKYGGGTYTREQRAPASYYYYHPWGWSSQAAHWALIANHYLASRGLKEEALGAVALQLRKNASRNPNAVMQTPLSLQDYMSSRYIVRPLRLFDMCLVNDGAVCLIVTGAERARTFLRPAIEVAGWGEAKVRSKKLHQLVREGLQSQLQEAGGRALTMAGLALSDVQHFEGYDPASIHLVDQLEGYGFVRRGDGLRAFADGEFALDGRLPVNIAGGMMSGSYMHGWSFVAEAVRQLRHEAGARQVRDVGVSMVSVAQTDQAHPLILTRGE